MRKTLLLLTLFPCLLLSGCTSFNQVEDLAFAEVLGIDLTGEGRIEVAIQIPKIAGTRGEAGSDGDSSPLIYSASGETLDEALHLLQWAVPRRLDLSQLELIVVSQSLAESDRFLKTANTVMATPRLYTAARLAICGGSAKEFISAQKPVIGTQISTELSAAFADYVRNGFIPSAAFADVFYQTHSIYSDALAIHAATASESAQPASALTPSRPDTNHIEAPQSNRFLGSAVFHQGKMIGTLSADEYLYCKILRGEQQAFPFSVNGQTVGITTLGVPAVQIDTQADPIRINVSIRFSIVSSSSGAPVEPLKAALEQKLTEVVNTCRKMHAEPFGFASAAAASFATIDDWMQFGWIDRFANSQVHLNVEIHNTKNNGK